MFNYMFQLEQVKQLPDVMYYLPDLKAGKYPEKEFFYMVRCRLNHVSSIRSSTRDYKVG